MKGKIIAGVVVVALVALWFVSPGFRKLVRFGYDSAQNARYSLSRSGGGGTRSGAQIDALAQQCRNQMTSMEQAKRAVLAQGGPGRSGVTVNDIAQRLGTRASTLVCPETGEAYRLGSMVDPVSCGVGNHGTPTYAADDHSITP
ncbi:MAG: hypothetical protein HUU25_01645 [Candidatus Sumerlaeia bacterium]|nr:hypothetical protein [Candidatus Sumerlaeia bacterium]